MTSIEVDELRGLLLFELFSDDKLAWVAGRARVVELAGRTELFAVGDRPASFWVLLDGELEVLRPIDQGAAVPFVSSSAPGAWAGVVPYVFDESLTAARLVRSSRLLEIPAADVRHMVDVGFPIAKHLMLGVTVGSQRWSARVAERERLTALGRLSAGLAHELNNPASAARRAADQLRVAIAAHEAAALDVARVAPRPDLAARLAGLRVAAADVLASAPILSPLDRSESEDEVAGWLAAAGIEDGTDLAPALVDAGLDVEAIQRLALDSTEAERAALLRWLAASVETTALLGEIESAATRIADLVKAVKAYSYMDRAEVATVDVRRGLEDTVRMLKSKLAGITVERDYDGDLATVVGSGGQLNQVWTNLIDNAADAAGIGGTIRLGAHAHGDGVVVTIEDNGPGIPEAVLRRVFEPFFTTKGVGRGTGLGLDISRRIVADVAGGELTVLSEPGQTIFRVVLPPSAPGSE